MMGQILMGSGVERRRGNGGRECKHTPSGGEGLYPEEATGLNERLNGKQPVDEKV